MNDRYSILFYYFANGRNFNHTASLSKLSGMAILQLLLFYLITVTSVVSQNIPWLLGPSYNIDPFGNPFVGQRDNGVFIFCNGLGCPARG
ncbi:unnamed protein product [Haemonchus placei]|uniref:Uncharacterized protein n=1 Tax=Haemonchus placei TaxID=6290 RepID=A0A0N4X8I8_HAEPC|nr:unnamed protein product [Haemonchus placei]